MDKEIKGTKKNNKINNKNNHKTNNNSRNNKKPVNNKKKNISSVVPDKIKKDINNKPVIKENKAKKEEVKKELIKNTDKEIKDSEDIVVEKKLSDKNNENPKSNTKKNNVIVLYVYGCVIIILLTILVSLSNGYFKSKSFPFDYLKFRAIGYHEDKKNFDLVLSDDGKCSITLSSTITDEVELREYGNLEKINKNSWARQEFENGITWVSYHKNMLYIVQMYAEDENTFNDICINDFEEIKKTFSFIKS